MPASQSGFGNLFVDRSGLMQSGYQIPVLGCPPAVQQQQQQLAAMAAAGIPITYSGLPGYNFIPYPHHRHITHMNNAFDMKATSPYHHALLARAGGGAAFYPQYRQGGPVSNADDPGRVTKVATRESTGALKAWLNEHLKNPYPTKGEKIMLAIITKMSLTQVSTWFANARRRLKKENRVSWASKGKSDAEEDDEEEDQDGDGDGDSEEDDEVQKCYLGEDGEPETEQSAEKQVQSPAESSPTHVEARLEEERGLALVEKVERIESSRTESKENVVSQKPKIWSLAETATSEPVKKPTDSIYHPAGKLWAEWASRNGLFVPSSYSATREIV